MLENSIDGRRRIEGYHCCEGDRQYIELINVVLPRLGDDAMKLFLDSGMTIGNFVEALYNQKSRPN